MSVIAENHAPGTDDACTAHDVEKHCFDIVVGIVSYGNSLSANIFKKRFEPSVTNFAASHLD